MPLTSHRDIHPVRRTVGLLLVAGAVIALLVACWKFNPLADRIEANVRVWQEKSAGLHDTP